MTEKRPKLSERSRRQLVLNQYKGKEELLSLYAVLLNVISKLGDDIEISPREDMVVLRVKKEFVYIIPDTNTNMIVGLNIDDKEPEGRLEPPGPLGTICTHRIQLADISDVDDEVVGYIREAYEGSK